MRTIRYFITVCLIAASLNVAYAQMPSQAEYNALMALYSSTNGIGWTTKTGWSSANPTVLQSVSGWYGIEVDVNGHVIGLDLHGNNLDGPLPTEIGDLGFLISLSLFNNHLTGSIPSEITNLSTTKWMSLKTNAFTGPLPSAIGSMTALISLDVSHNQLSGAIPSSFVNLSNLENAYFTANGFTSLPSGLGNLTKLVDLDLAQNSFTGAIPADLFDLTALIALSIYTNQFSGPLSSDVGNLTHLQRLYVSNNQLSGTLPSSIGNLTQLKQFVASNNQFSGAIPSSIGNITTLNELYLDGNDLTSMPSGIWSFPNLWTLNLDNNNIGGTIPSDIGNLPMLSGLALGGNEFTGAIPASMGSLSSLVALELNNNHLTGNVPASLSNLTSLQRISIGNNELSGTLPAYAGKLTSVTIGGAKFTFSSFLPMLLANNPGIFNSYWPQALVDEAKTLNGQLGGSITLTTSIDRSTATASVYQWFKKVGSVTTALNTASSSGHTYQITNLQQSDEGTQYFYTITNPSAPNLTLTSNLQTLHVIVCEAPGVSFATAVDAYTYTFTPTVNNTGSCTTSYLWDFGDGQTSPDATSSHVFNTTGTYLVSLTLSYKCGECDSTAVVVQDTVEVSNTSICTAIYCDGYGNVGIGTMRTQGFRLSVDGKIRASEIIKVYPQGQWSDFVFEDKYRLRPLSEVESFIKKNGHLPDIPSAKEVEKEGVELGSMDAKLLQKIEELTLYVIELKKDNDQIKAQNAAMRKEINDLKQK